MTLVDQLNTVGADGAPGHNRGYQTFPVKSFDNNGNYSGFYHVEGVINDQSSEVVLNMENCSGGIISIDGTFNGCLEVVGAATITDTVQGGRLLFQAGVGSIGTNRIRSDGTTPFKREFRLVLGGNVVRVRKCAGEWISGSVTVRILAQQHPNVMFIAGPVHGSQEEATRDKRAFTSSAGPVEVLAQQALYVEFINPAGSAKNVFITRRLFGNDQLPTAVPFLQYRAYINPPAVMTNLSPIANFFIGGIAPLTTLRWQVAPAPGLAGALNMGTIGGSGEVLPNGRPYARETTAVLPPNYSLGFVVGGAGQNLNQAVRLSVTFEWFEEDIT